MRANELIGRDRELAVAEAFLADARERLAVLSIEGEPGIGKSALWHAVVARARDHGLLVLSCRPAAGGDTSRACRSTNDRHVWVWRANPAGTFVQWNQRALLEAPRHDRGPSGEGPRSLRYDGQASLVRRTL